MKITIDIPDELLQHYNYNNLTREILEALVVRAYRAEKITSAEVGSILGRSSRWVLDAFLKNHDADLHYNEVDLESDRKTLQQLRNKHDHSLL
ncbi:MAG: UPF0175 family protein [Microcystis sp.]